LTADRHGVFIHTYETGTRADLIDAARAEFAALGFAGASVGRSRRRRVPTWGDHYHFGSKQALYEAVVGEAMGEVVRRVGEAVASPGRSPLDRRRAWCGPSSATSRSTRKCRG